MRYGASSLCLILWLSGCATLPSLLPTNRVVVSCPAELQYQPTRAFPQISEPLTNQSLEEFALLLIVQIRREWNKADQAASDCREWLRSQQPKS